MDTAKKILLFSVGIILTVGFIAIGMTIYNKARTSIANSSSQYDSLIGQFSEIEYSFYEGDRSTASGSEIIKLIKGQKSGGVEVYVRNGVYCDANGTTGSGVKFAYGATDCGYTGNTVTYANAIKYMEDKKQSYFYINPTAGFTCEVERDANGTVSGLTFTQK